jgi:hypothetical protein
VRNTEFINIFKAKFLKGELTSNKNHLKNLQSHQNPLFHLINIDKQQQRQNILVNELITLAASLIEINKYEILDNAFYRPSQETLTYSILFDESLNSLPIYTETVKHLHTQWKKWESEGVLANDIWRWKNFTPEQTVVVRKIWTLVTQNAGNKYQFDALFDANHQDMKAKLEMHDKVVTCLNTYCQQASDNKVYYTAVQEWHNRFERENIKSIKIPKILEDIIPFAEKLNSYANVHSWRTYLNKRTTINGKICSIHLSVNVFEKMSA